LDFIAGLGDCDRAAGLGAVFSTGAGANDLGVDRKEPLDLTVDSGADDPLDLFTGRAAGTTFDLLIEDLPADSDAVGADDAVVMPWTLGFLANSMPSPRGFTGPFLPETTLDAFLSAAADLIEADSEGAGIPSSESSASFI
jgi:hypothetical protein